MTGVEASPALPLVFPDPSIYPSQLPKGLQGDVIVEVTIDEHGTVTETKVVQSLQSDIDDKVIATLKNEGPDEAKKLLGIPEDRRAVVIVAIGHTDREARKAMPKQGAAARKPMQEFAHIGKF